MNTLLIRASFIALALWPVVGCGRSGLDEPASVAKPWTWRSEQHGFEVTVPSDRWDRRPNENVIAVFGANDLMAMVAEARPAETDAEWQAALQFIHMMRMGKAASNAEEKSGPNAHGHESWLYVADVKDASKRYFLGMSITRVGGKGVVLMFEGRAQSDPDRILMQRKLATQFLSSVK